MQNGGSRGLWQSSEALRREERRAQARLQGGLQRLEQVTNYHLNTVTAEQRRLRNDLLSIRIGNSWKRRLQPLVARSFSLDAGHDSIPCKTTLPTITRAIRQPEKQRSLKPACGGVSSPACGGVSSPAALQARVHDFLCSTESADTWINSAERSVAPLCLPDLKPQPAATLTITGLVGRGEEGRAEGRAEGEGEDRWGREARAVRRKEKEEDKGRDGEKEWCSPPSSPASPSTLPPATSDSLAPDGRPRTLHLLPDFSQSLAEARKARYIRYRGKPLCERELSISEIFAKGNTNPAH